MKLPLPAAVVAKLMRSSGGGGGGGVPSVEMLNGQLETSSFHSSKGNNCNVNYSSPAFWNKSPDIDFCRQASHLPVLGNEEESLIDHDVGLIQNSFAIASAKQSQRKAATSNGNSCRRSRQVHMEACFNVTGSIDVNGLSKELGSYHGKCNVSEKMQIAKQKTVSVKRKEKRNAKISKNKCDAFSVKAGLSSFSSAAGGNNIFGISSKQDICNVAKHVDELSLNELLNGTYKRPQSVKEQGRNTAHLNEKILHSVRDACLIIQLRKSTQLKNSPLEDSTNNQNASSCLPNTTTFKSDDGKGDTIDPTSCNKVENSCSGVADHPNILEFPLFSPKDVVERLALSPPKDLDLLLLDSMKPTLSSKNNLDPRSGKFVHSRGSLPTFPWSHISGGHYKTNPDVVKLTTNKSACHSRWVKIGNSAFSFGDTTTSLADLESLVYDQSLVPSTCSQPGPSETTTLPIPSGVCLIASTTSGCYPDGDSAGVLAAAEILCKIATHFQKQDENGTTMRWPKRPSQKCMRATKLKSNEQLEKALFRNSEERHELKRPLIPTRLSNKPPKLRKLVPTECRSPTNKNR